MLEQKSKLQILLDENAIGAEEFANCLGISVNNANELLVGKKSLNKSLARQIEQTFSKPANWLDTQITSQGNDYDLFG